MSYKKNYNQMWTLVKFLLNKKFFFFFFFFEGEVTKLVRHEYINI